MGPNDPALSFLITASAVAAAAMCLGMFEPDAFFTPEGIFALCFATVLALLLWAWYATAVSQGLFDGRRQ